MPHENVHVHPRPSRIRCCRAGTCWARAGTNVNVFSGALFTSVSYVEQDGGLPAPPTVRALDEAVQAQMRLSEPAAGPPSQAALAAQGLRPWALGTLRLQGASMRFNASAALVSLDTNHSGSVRHWADAGHPLGFFRYATHSEEELNRYRDQVRL